MPSLATLVDRHGVDVLDHLDRQVDVPVLTAAQRQGDVFILPAEVAASTPVPAAGTPVVRGENGGNTHAIFAEGDVRCDLRQADIRDLTLATLTVADGAVAWLLHPEHGAQGIGCGSYRLLRKREQADELRLIAD